METFRPSASANKKARPRPSFFDARSQSGLEAEAAETLVELRKTTAAVHELLVAAGPGRMRLGIDFQVHDSAFSTPGGAGFVFRAIGHDDLDDVVVGMN